MIDIFTFTFILLFDTSVICFAIKFSICKEMMSKTVCNADLYWFSCCPKPCNIAFDHLYYYGKKLAQKREKDLTF